MVDRFELTAIDRHYRLREQTESTTQNDKLAACAANRQW
jgi:hypothetical protein